MSDTLVQPIIDVTIVNTEETTVVQELSNDINIVEVSGDDIIVTENIAPVILEVGGVQGPPGAQGIPGPPTGPGTDTELLVPTYGTATKTAANGISYDSFSTGEDVFFIWNTPEGLDRTVSPSIKATFFPTSDNALADVTWQIFITVHNADHSYEYSTFIELTDQALGTTAYDKSYINEALDFSTLLINDVNIFHFDIRRIASTNNPAFGVGLTDIRVEYNTDGAIGETGPKGDTGDTGPQGIQGEQGIQGLTGPAGADGTDGADGLQGPKGDTGDQGPQGFIGPAGPRGYDGPQGPQGNQGLQGPEGPEGPQGDQGIQGPEGPAGPTGAQGPQGDQGIQGEQGIQGLTGPAGLQGPEGPKGDTGATGPQGPEGDQGPRGFTGLTGPEGPQGDQGPQGNQGLQGPEGPEGPQGDQGPQGIQGDQGIQGPTGPQGLQGYQGIQGIQGPQGPTGPEGPQGEPGVPEDQVPYNKKVDFITDEDFYIGEAEPGIPSTAAFWRIKHVVIAGDGDVDITWAGGNANMDNVWDNRLSYSYS